MLKVSIIRLTFPTKFPVSEAWPLTKRNQQSLQRSDRIMIRQICSIKPGVVATVRSRELPAKPELESERESEDLWFGHVEHSSGAVSTACDIQVE